MNSLELLKRAKSVLDLSYSPYSKFRVSAAALMNDFKVYTGVNIESASYGATICAERVAISKAISSGSKVLKKLAVVASKDLIYPCGICRQFIAEFASEDFVLIIESKDGILEYKLDEILPFAFTGEDLNE